MWIRLEVLYLHRKKLRMLSKWKLEKLKRKVNERLRRWKTLARSCSSRKNEPIHCIREASIETRATLCKIRKSKFLGSCRAMREKRSIERVRTEHRGRETEIEQMYDLTWAKLDLWLSCKRTYLPLNLWILGIRSINPLAFDLSLRLVSNLFSLGILTIWMTHCNLRRATGNMEN